MPKITGSYLFNNWKSWVGLRSAGPIKLTNIQSIPNWKKEWGAEKPGSDEITAANKATETVLRLYGSIESSRAAAYILVETNIKALYLANRDAAITTLAYYRGNHEGLAVYLRKNTTPAFWAELIGPLLNEDAKYASGAISLLDMLFYSIPQKEEIGPFFVDHGLAKSLLEWVSTSEPHKLTSDFGSLLPKLLLMANKVLKTCIEQEDNKIWKSLSEETREKLLTYNETVSNANLLKKRVDKAHTTWKKEWGEGPDDRAIVKAKKELKIIRETFGGTKSSLSANSLADGVDLVDIRALYLVDKEAAIDTLAYMSGCHTTIAGLLRLDTTPAFWAELIGPLLKKDAKHASGALALLNMLFNSNQQKDKFGPFFVDHGLAKPLLEWIGRAKPGELGTHHETLILMASKILKTCLERKDIKIWESLSDETREKLFTHNETVVNADLLNIEAMRNRADEAHSAWNEEAWGYAPLDEEIERARDWIENTVKQDGFNIHSPELAHSSFRNGIDFVALFLIDKELYKLLIGNSFGRHNDISGRLKGQTLSFWAETLKLILEDDIAPAKDYDTAICYLTNAMLVHQRVILGKLTELLPIIAEHNLEEPILRQAKFLRYITNMTARGGFVNLLKIIFKFGVSETDKLVKIWQKLPEESRQALLKIKGIEKEAQEIHDAWEGSSTETETKIKWKEEWGAAPTEKQIAAAKEWADKIRASNMELRSRNLASRALTDKVNLKALWLIDPGLLRILMVFCAGSHQKIGDQLGYNDSLWAELTRFLLESKHEPPANDHEAGQEYLSGTIKYLSKMISSNYNEFMAFIKKNNLYEPFLRQAPYLKHITRFATAFFGPICEAGLEHLIENDQAEEVWKSLSEKARQGLLEDEHTERLAIQIQKACQQREEYSSNEFEAFQKAIIEIEPKLLHEKSKVNYSKEIAQKFYELIPKEERGRALAAMDQETAGLIVRSAKGIHGPIGRAVNDMPTQAAVELLERELKLVPNDLIKNREMAHTFRDTDNFGAFKCFLVRKELGEGVSYQDLSLLWTELSLDGKADFFRVLHIYSILVDEVSTNETLIPNLASKIKRSSINEQREIYNACSKEVQTFLKERKIVNLEEPKKTDEPAPSEKYLPALQQEFDTTNNTKAERANAFSFLWHEDRETAARLIRTVKFHEIARDMLSDLDDTELAQVLDTSLVDAPKFSDQTAVKRFDQLDSSVVVRGLCLLPQEKAEGALNLVKDETLARVFDQAFVVCGGVLTPARSRSYVHNLLSQALRSGQVDQEKVAKALQSCQRRTIAWVRGIYRGKLDISVARAKAERLIEKDPMAQRIIKAKIKTHRMARQILEIAGAAVSKQEPHFTQLMLPSLQDAEGDAVFALKNELSKDAVRKIGILYDAVRENEKLAAQQNHEEYLTSQMFYLMRIAVNKVIDWAADQIYQGKADLPDDIKVHKEGAIGRIIIIDEPDEERREAILSSLEPFHAVVTTQYPSAWSKTSPVSAMITSACDGIYSHAASRAKEVGAAVGNLPGATRLLRPFNGKWVKISLSGSPKIRLASEEEEAMDRQQHSLLTVSESQTGKVYSIPLLKIDLERDKARFGPKVFKIADMALAGFQVPQSAFITSSLCHLLYQKLELYDAIPKILGDNPLAQEQKVIKQKLRKIKELFTQAETPKQVADILLKLNHGLPGDSRIFRPGLPFEDLPDFNAAGYMDSPVSSNEEKAVLLAMLSGYASYWNLLPFMAREENGLNHFRFLPGAAFMELIAAQAAGNMIVSEENILISAVYGQGQGGNEGRIPPDYYEIDRKTEEIKHTPARERRSKMIFSEGSMVKIDLSLSEATNPPLNDDQVVGIGAEGERAFELYGPQPREVEWAYQNGVWILQDRTAIL